MTKVLVVGAGPVGLMMASELRRHGVDCRLVDKASGPSEHSKALVIWPRTLEILDRIGLVDAFVAAGHKMPGMRIHAGPRLLSHIRLAGLASPFPFALTLPQRDSERLLADHFQRLGGQVERDTECTTVTQNSAQVQATLVHRGESENIEVDWVVGCDGAHSTVRHQVHLPFDGLELPSTFHLGDVQVDGLDSPDLMLYWSAAGLLAFFPLSPPAYRIVGTASSDTVTLESLQAMVDARGPGGVRLRDPQWIASFHVHERQVASYRAGRVFLAGDAAHIHSPAGGQGLNTGLQDAFNLAWKLAFATDPHGPLLDSYTVERHAVGRQVLTSTGYLTWLATLSQPWAQAVRNVLLGWLGGRSAVQAAGRNNLSGLNVHYPHSPVHGVDGGFAGRVKAGDRAPDGLLQDGRHLHQALKTSAFTLLGLNAPDAVLAWAAALWDVNIVSTVGTLDALYGVGPALYLIRPDGYVGVSAVPTTSQDLLGLWFDRLGVPRRT